MFKCAWQAIASDFPGMELWQQIIWVVFFPLLYLMTLLALWGSNREPPKGKEVK